MLPNGSAKPNTENAMAWFDESVISPSIDVTTAMFADDKLAEVGSRFCRCSVLDGDRTH